MIDDLIKVRIRLQALKESMQEHVDKAIEINSPVYVIEWHYDPIRRIESIERLLYGQEG